MPKVQKIAQSGHTGGHCVSERQAIYLPMVYDSLAYVIWYQHTWSLNWPFQIVNYLLKIRSDYIFKSVN